MLHGFGPMKSECCVASCMLQNVGTNISMIYIFIFILQFRRLALKSPPPPLGPKWDRWAKKLGCASVPPILADCRLEDRMCTRVFSPTYPTWALVEGLQGQPAKLYFTRTLFDRCLRKLMEAKMRNV